MKVQTKRNQALPGAPIPAGDENSVVTAEDYPPRKMTFAENAIFLCKILAAFALLGGLLWMIDLWKSAK